MSKPIYNLFSWAVVNDTEPHIPPELQYIQLTGFRGAETKKVITSQVIDAKGHCVETLNSIYILQNIDPDYRAWLTKTGYPFDPDNPIKVKFAEVHKQWN